MNIHAQNQEMVSTTGIPTLPTTSEVKAKWHLIDQIDLSNIKRRLVMSRPEGNAWSQEFADTAITWYRRYLKLQAKYPGERLVPNHSIDTVWHRHILDTRAYARDCDSVFGRMLHHYPYFGMNGDERRRNEAFEQTDLLYIAEFGTSCKGNSSLTKTGSMCDGNGGAGCLGT